MQIDCRIFRFDISKIKFYMNIFQKSENVVILPKSQTRSNECVSLLQKHSSNVQLTLRGQMTDNLNLQRLPSMHELLHRVSDVRSPPHTPTQNPKIKNSQDLQEVYRVWYQIEARLTANVKGVSKIRERGWQGGQSGMQVGGMGRKKG